MSNPLAVLTVFVYVKPPPFLIPQATGDFTLLLASIQLGCKFVANAVRKASIKHLIGLEGQQNVQGEDQKKLDVLAVCLRSETFLCLSAF